MMALTEQDKQNTVERLKWLEQTVRIKQTKCDRQAALVANFAYEVAAKSLAAGLYQVTKKQLDRARVPHVPFLTLEPHQYRVS